MNSLERRFVIAPAYDKRNTDSNKNYGIHGVDMRWYVVGPEGAIQFVLFTNWHLPAVQVELDAKSHGDPKYIHLSCHPQPADIGYHSHKPRYANQTRAQEHCAVIDGPCYYDGSGLQADDFYRILVEKGGDALWEALEKRYHEWLVEEAA